MNKVLLVGRLTRDPETNTTSSGIKYTRFTMAVDRQYGEDQADYVPIVAWRSQAEFVEKYIRKGSLISVEGRFTSSSYQSSEGQTVYRNEVTVDRVQGLESRAQAEQRRNAVQADNSAPSEPMQFEDEKKPLTKANAEEEDNQDDVPWELDL